MQVDEPMKYWLENGCNLVFSEFFLRDVKEIDDATGMTILQHNPKVVVFKVCAIVFNDVLIIA